MCEAIAQQTEPSPAQSVTEISDDVWSHRCALLHCAYVSYRYHRHRQRSFDLMDKGSKSLTVALVAAIKTGAKMN